MVYIYTYILKSLIFIFYILTKNLSLMMYCTIILVLIDKFYCQGYELMSIVMFMMLMMVYNYWIVWRYYLLFGCLVKHGIHCNWIMIKIRINIVDRVISILYKIQAVWAVLSRHIEQMGFVRFLIEELWQHAKIILIIWCEILI